MTVGVPGTAPWWPDDELQIVVRAVDAGATFVTFRPLVPGRTLVTHRVDQGVLDAALGELAAALPDPLPGETDGPRHIRRAMSGALIDLDRERALSGRLGGLLIPPAVWDLLSTGHEGPPVRLRVTPSARLATVPWELLLSPDGQRLADLAILSFELPPTIHFRRPRAPMPYAVNPAAGPLRTIDPFVPGAQAFSRALSAAGRRLIEGRLGVSCGGLVDRADLSRALREHPPRWVYFGHVSIPERGLPGAAGLHLSDGLDSRGRSYAGTGAVIGHGGHRALTVIDLLRGTQTSPWHGDDRLAADPGQRGSEVWPMPARVALIACNSGADHTATEPLGLVAAAHMHGAEYVTATRWSLPTDEAFSRLRSVDGLPTSNLVLAVDAAHEADDPVAALREWQRAAVARWDAAGELRDSPLLWAALTTHHAPARNPDGSDPSWPPFPADGQEEQ